ncbi:potassium channel family protein [Blastococcus sp. SYSU DS0973]
MADPTTGDTRRERWERGTEWPLTTAAVLFLAAYAWPILEPDLATPWRWLCNVLTWVTWVAFAVDFVVRLTLAQRRWQFVRTHLLDLAVVVLPLFRPLRLLRLVTLLSVLNRHAGRSLRGRVVIYVSGATALVMLVSSLAILDAERGAEDANIETYGGALWWSFATVTTVGYGDQYPVTTTGRVIAAGLMLAGIALLGIITATFASWLVQRVEEIEDESAAATRQDVQALVAEIVALRAEVARGTGHAGDGPPGTGSTAEEAARR